MTGTGLASTPEFARETPDAVLTDTGRYETLAAAKYLQEFFHERRAAYEAVKKDRDRSWPENSQLLKLGGVLHSDSPEARETAAAFCKGYLLDPVSPTQSELLGPKTAPSHLRDIQEGVQKDAEKHLTGGSNAVVFVGHQPAVGWFAAALLGYAVPVVQSEILCIQLGPPGKSTLSWSISPSDDTALTALQEKIKSKMALANVLSGFLTAGIGVFLSLLADKDKIGGLGVQTVVVFVAAAFLIAAVFLYLRTMFSYDTLLMPVRFWAETASGSGNPAWIVARPPSGAPWILYQNMLRIWQKQFIPATILTLSGLLILWSAVCLATFDISHSQHWHATAWARVLSLAPTAVLLLLFFSLRGTKIGNWFVRKSRYQSGPWLGSED